MARARVSATSATCGTSCSPASRSTSAQELTQEDDDVVVSITLARIGTSSLTLREEIRKLDGTLVGRGRVGHRRPGPRDRPLAPSDAGRSASALRAASTAATRDAVTTAADRHHLVRAARALGRMGAPGRARAALLRRVGRAGRRPRARHPAEHRRGRRDAGRPRRRRLLGRHRHRSVELRRRASRLDRSGPGAPRRRRARAPLARARARRADARDLPRLPAPQRPARRGSRPAPSRVASATRATERCSARSPSTPSR